MNVIFKSYNERFLHVPSPRSKSHITLVISVIHKVMSRLQQLSIGSRLRHMHDPIQTIDNDTYVLGHTHTHTHTRNKSKGDRASRARAFSRIKTVLRRQCISFKHLRTCVSVPRKNKVLCMQRKIKVHHRNRLVLARW